MQPKLVQQKQARLRSLAIRAARFLNLVTPENLDPCFIYSHSPDPDLEQFLRRNNLTYALELYEESQRKRTDPELN